MEYTTNEYSNGTALATIIEIKPAGADGTMTAVKFDTGTYTSTSWIANEWLELTFGTGAQLLGKKITVEDIRFRKINSAEVQ